MSAYASFFDSIIVCSARAELCPYSASGNVSMMLSISSAAIPWPFGGSSWTVQPWYVVEIGSTHSPSNPARSAAVIVPPWPAYGRDDLPGDLTLVERIASLRRDLPVRPCEVGVPEDLADGGRVSVDEIGLRRGVVGPQRLLAVVPEDAHHLAHGESVLGVRDGGCEDIGELQLPESREELVPSVHRARDGHRVDAVLRHLGDPLGAQELRRQALGRPARGVEAVESSRSSPRTRSRRGRRRRRRSSARRAP